MDWLSWTYHVHEDVSKHAHDELVLIPGIHESIQECIIRTVCDLTCGALKFFRYAFLDTFVEHVAVLVEDKSVSIPGHTAGREGKEQVGRDDGRGGKSEEPLSLSLFFHPTMHPQKERRVCGQ